MKWVIFAAVMIVESVSATQSLRAGSGSCTEEEAAEAKLTEIECTLLCVHEEKRRVRCFSGTYKEIDKYKNRLAAILRPIRNQEKLAKLKEIIAKGKNLSTVFAELSPYSRDACQDGQNTLSYREYLDIEKVLDCSKLLNSESGDDSTRRAK